MRHVIVIMALLLCTATSGCAMTIEEMRLLAEETGEYDAYWTRLENKERKKAEKLASTAFAEDCRKRFGMAICETRGIYVKCKCGINSSIQ